MVGFEGMDEAGARDNILYEKGREAVREVIETFKERLAFEGSINTGLRASEFLHLNRNWIKEGNSIRAHRKQECDCNECLKRRDGLWTPKTEYSERTILLLSQAEEILDQLFSFHGSVLEVIPSRSTLRTIVRKLRYRAGIDKKNHPHGLRASFAYLMANHGSIDVFALRDIMGWKTIEPARYYIKLAGKEVKRRRRAVDDEGVVA